MSAPKAHIGRAYGQQGLRTARTLNEAYGPYARLHVEQRTRAERLDALIGRACFVIVCAAVLALVINAAFGGA